MAPAVRVSWWQQQLQVRQERPVCPALQQQDGQVDLDPYGSPAAFLDSAVQCVADGVIYTCRYGSYPVRGKYRHEMALRILLACMESHAIRHKRYIVPVISVHMDFYIRVFVRIFTLSPASASPWIRGIFLYQIFALLCLKSVLSVAKGADRLEAICGCAYILIHYLNDICTRANGHANIFALKSLCMVIFSVRLGFCVVKYLISLHMDVICYNSKLSAVDVPINTGGFAKFEYFVELVELPNAPLFVSLHSICATLKCTNPTMVMFHSAIRNAGYQISGSHADPLALKTDAPMSVIWDIMRCWVKLHPVKSQPENLPGSRILSQEPQLQASFSQATGGLVARKSPRFLPNPEKHWGPKMKAGRPLKILPIDKL
uniref:Putative N(2),N(2)-dimethylguanosine tRNA methyltransferase 1 n=1 Tax=Aegilops tauschii TaxID=37682 RepID=N1QRV3_AEGTA